MTFGEPYQAFGLFSNAFFGLRVVALGLFVHRLHLASFFLTTANHSRCLFVVCAASRACVNPLPSTRYACSDSVYLRAC
jgi:hypothetical protein